MGGPGSERQVSLASGKAVLNALLSIGLDAVPVDVTGTEIHLPEGTGLCFNVIHGTFGEDGQLQEILDTKGVPLHRRPCKIISDRLRQEPRKTGVPHCRRPHPKIGNHRLHQRPGTPLLPCPVCG